MLGGVAIAFVVGLLLENVFIRGPGDGLGLRIPGLLING
jgi:hypothetical protein